MNYSLQCYMMELPIKSTFEELFSHLITIWGQDPETVQAKDLIVRQVTVCPVSACVSLLDADTEGPAPPWVVLTLPRLALFLPWDFWYQSDQSVSSPKRSATSFGKFVHRASDIYKTLYENCTEHMLQPSPVSLHISIPIKWSEELLFPV